VSQVHTGLDRWLAEGPGVARLERGARLGLLVHSASVDRRGHHAIETLIPGGACPIVKLFAPEHGLWGHEQDMEPVDDATDLSTGLPVVSLYGRDAGSLQLHPQALDGVDAVVFDLQDVGSRYYTFVYTLSYAMEAAARAGLPVVVFDRPNPIGGTHVEGPVLRPGLASFVGRYPIPVRHGMTVGELAALFNEVGGIGCDLRVVEMHGWQRSMQFEQTGLPWVPPSPNMPTAATARVYPGGCLVEGTNLSEGRGTTTPFELVGAPWLDGDALTQALRAAALPGVLFRSASFRPMFQKHAGQACRGVQVIVSDIDRFRPFRTFLALIREVLRLAPEFAWRADAYEFETTRPAIDLLLGRDDLRPMLETGATLEQMEACWSDEAAEFLDARQRFLIYRA